MTNGEHIEAALREALGDPTFKQALFLSSEARYVGYGGARGAAESRTRCGPRRLISRSSIRAYAC